MSPIDPLRTALLLIDVQASFTARPYWSTAELPAFLAATNRLIDGARQAGLPIVRILHTDGPDRADNPFAPVSGLVCPLDGLVEVEPARTVEKHRHSALVGTGLGDWLRAQRITRLIVAGIRTEQCCETTARHASDEGWEVDYVTEATLTFDMTTPAGERLSAAQIRERTETVLAGRFATLCTVDQALARAATPEAVTP
ncbi:isochorismatase family protein [Ideonella sp. B7]|uniref:isochorismatase family protein n=1 Tax=Ideonella benzenivorans TaxID=2831643 RepID=UPI001CED3A7D|nr:isochorismatase family protein [Ideonella benzenivorans]MCA6218735.1 isochorismatase family protein [Ideonella benzenivorans]